MKEYCGIFGIVSDEPVFDTIYNGLYSLQHRGQESAGIAVYDKTDINCIKDMGLVHNVFKGKRLEGTSGIGHVRYSTTGESDIKNAQPLVIHYAKGSFAIAHNGNLINAEELRETLKKKGSIFSTTTDSEVIAQMISQEHIKSESFIDAIKDTMKKLKGSYSLVILYQGDVIAVRDPMGIRPLVLGKKANNYLVASESCAFDVVDAKLIRDVKPSEIIRISGGETVSDYAIKDRKAHCMFEYVYFARPDSVINERSVYGVRKTLGSMLAELAPAEAELVVPVPDSGIAAAIGYAETSGIPYGEGLIKNRYIGRTFIMPEQIKRETNVKMKLNPIKSEIKGRDIILVDDSLVRGTTMKKIVKLLTDCGANEVHVRISSPPIRYPCRYGIDMQTSNQFIASEKDINQIGKIIGASSLAYLSIDNLISAINIPKEDLCLGCLTGEYPVKEEVQARLGE